MALLGPIRKRLLSIFMPIATSYFQIESTSETLKNPMFTISPAVPKQDKNLGILFDKLQEIQDMMSSLMFHTQKIIMVFWTILLIGFQIFYYATGRKVVETSRSSKSSYYVNDIIPFLVYISAFGVYFVLMAATALWIYIHVHFYARKIEAKLKEWSKEDQTWEIRWAIKRFPGAGKYSNTVIHVGYQIKKDIFHPCGVPDKHRILLIKDKHLILLIQDSQ
jgi:hypothetical protein